ncbi:uncharacterized protein TNCV_4969601 [Trichonephila clavipes]|nr:uncharacterized protein TNCV_4969601 [Trichonephila clavipes]
MSHCLATRGRLATDHVILNHGQMTWTTPELAPPLLTTTPHQWEDVSALDRFKVHRCPTRLGAIETTRNITARVIERDTSGEIYYFLEDSRGFRTRQHGHQ